MERVANKVGVRVGKTWSSGVWSNDDIDDGATDPMGPTVDEIGDLIRSSRGYDRVWSRI